MLTYFPFECAIFKPAAVAEARQMCRVKNWKLSMLEWLTRTLASHKNSPMRLKVWANRHAMLMLLADGIINWWKWENMKTTTAQHVKRFVGIWIYYVRQAKWTCNESGQQREWKVSVPGRVDNGATHIMTTSYVLEKSPPKKSDMRFFSFFSPE